MEYAEQQHLNNLMINMPVGSDSLESTIFETKHENKNKNMTGGSINIDEPFGGFPPIYQCTENEKKRKDDKDDVRKRGSSLKTGVTLKEILSKRKGTVPLFEFGNSDSSDSNISYMGAKSDSVESEQLIEKVEINLDL